MTGKVSLVIPCYNKEKYIGSMLQSVFNQDWDNIELILVNDGSTDGTRNVIAQWEPKLKARGYEVIVADKKNGGVADAVKCGLERVTGEFVCQLDADDEIEPAYVSTLAGWLSENPDYSWAACDAIKTSETSSVYIRPFLHGAQSCNAENWILRRIAPFVWLYMVRADYFKKCRVTELFYTGSRGDQEFQYFAPLVFGGGKLKHVKLPLYRYNFADAQTHLSHSADYEAAKKLYRGRVPVYLEVIRRLPIEADIKKRLSAIAEMKSYTFIFSRLLNLNAPPDDLKDATDNILVEMKKHFINAELLCPKTAHKHPRLLCAAIEDNILGITPPKTELKNKRVIAWGVLGKNAQAILSYLENTVLKPTLLWDAKGDGVSVLKPDINLLDSGDIVLILPSFAGDISDAVEKSKCNTCISNDEILTYLASSKFPCLYDGTIKFRG